jgi:hypothetical protein
MEMDVRQKLHGYTLDERHRQVAVLELPSEVPENITSAFAVARNLGLYGWFHWPLYVRPLIRHVRAEAA